MNRLKPLKITNPTAIIELKGLKVPTRIFIKRDDLNGLLISGNKARKLEYLMADAKNKHCNTLVTCGPVQSNHCRTTAVFAQHFGLECHLLLRRIGKPSNRCEGNLLLDKLLGAKIKYVTPAQYEQRNDIMKQYAKRLRTKGKRPYIIPEGGSNEIGSLGYIDCMREMVGFIQENKIEAIYCAVGSGGTYAGLLMGKKLSKLEVDLNGIIICDNIEYFTDRILRICQNAITKFGINANLARDDIKLIDGFVGKGYGVSYPEELNTIRDVAKLGIILEPVYTGKAFYGMLNHLKKNRHKKVIFIHTGGIYSIFAYSQELIPRALKN